MKIFKTADLAALMVSGVAVAAQATVLTVTGENAAISTIAFAAAAHTLAANMTSGVTALSIGTLRIDNNDHNGYTVTIESDKAGKLVRYNTGTGTYSSDSVPGNFVPYTLQLVSSGGTMGATEPSTFATPTLAASPGTTYDFSTGGVSEATVAKTYNVEMTRAADARLFNSSSTGDEYRDVLTVTMADLQ